MRWPPCISFWENTVHSCLCLVSLSSKRVSWMMEDNRLPKSIGSVGWRNKFPRTIVVTNEKKVRQMNGGVYLSRVDSDSRTQSENLNAIDCYSICFAVIAVIVWEFPWIHSVPFLICSGGKVRACMFLFSPFGARNAVDWTVFFFKKIFGCRSIAVH